MAAYGLNGNVKNDLHAFAPRLGVAYQLTPKTVVRMGYGRSYDIGVFGSNFGHTVTQNLPVLIKQNIDASAIRLPTGANPNDIPLFTLAQGPIAPIFPAIPSNGQITFASLNGQDGGVHIRPIKQVLPTLDAWNATVQRQVTNTISAEVAYVGNKGSHGFVETARITTSIPCPCFCTEQRRTLSRVRPMHSDLRRPLCHPNLATDTCAGIGDDLGNFYGNDASSEYNAFEIKVDKRFAQGLQFIAHYTFAHANAYNNNYYAISHPIAYGPNDFVRNQVFVINTVYALAIRQGQNVPGQRRARRRPRGGWMAGNQYHQLEQRSALDANHQRVRQRAGRGHLPSEQRVRFVSLRCRMASASGQRSARQTILYSACNVGWTISPMRERKPRQRRLQLSARTARFLFGSVGDQGFPDRGARQSSVPHGRL